ncbi:protein NODULATION SIGNALING PATHWAY 2-like [Arachis duranensis]|uniref:Protein NODULATION SIGNALING PATHWAY 2-like n=1 Tax=Arachis duranensis TaxID=130453 RepID=A0A6P4BAD4_ARADU|nr:protein NODULATION SIGNALING PATHWAY 2-like [Arachis duranensis]
MEIDMLDIHNIEFSGYSTTTTPSSDENPAYTNWTHWSPLVNWEAIAAPYDDFHHLIDSIIDHHHATTPLHLTPDHDDEDDTTTANTADDESPPLPTTPTPTIAGEDETKGLRLVHLLMAAAESLTGATKSRDLARVILLRLKELVPFSSTSSSTGATNMERLAAHFTQALQGLLDGAGGGGAHNNHSNNNKQYNYWSHQTETLTAFQLLQDMSPYVKFAHFTANQAILEAIAHHRRAHIVDFDIMEGIQWASLLQALASHNKTASPGPHLRITALSRTGSGRRSIATVQETGRRLTAFAASLGQPFSFHHCRMDPDETFRPNGLKLVRGEALVFNCMLNLPHLPYRARDSVASFLNGAKDLSPVLVTMAEEDIGPVGVDAGFVGRFMDSLHHYSAFYDSLEAGFPMEGRARALVERVFLGPRIAASLGRIYRTSEGKEERGSWREWLCGMGFKGVPLSSANQSQAKLLINLFKDGYKLEQLGSNQLVLSWESRRLFSTSIWSSSSSYSQIEPL